MSWQLRGVTPGKLAIRRGHERAPPPPPPPPRAVLPIGLAPVEARLEALERLARLHREGALSEAEYAAEKAAILALRESAPSPSAPSHPSLLGRILGSRLLGLGLVAGLALSLVSQPAETKRAADEILRLLGA